MTNKLFGFAIFVTGLCSLGYQIVWQKYLSLFLGSEARSSTLIVSVFLIGLSIGYYLFGSFSKKLKNRKQLLQIYGYIEAITGLYCLFFPKIFQFFFNSNISIADHIVVQIILTAILLLLPTVLMGATIPIMTSVLPEGETDVNRVHSKIYGINTLGAFTGTLATGLFIVPKFGFPLTMGLLGTVNIIVSFIYIFNRLEGEQQDKVLIPKNEKIEYPEKVLFFFSFFIGAMTISFEMYWIRFVALSIGSGHIVFPFVISIFVLAIGAGSLSLRSNDHQSFLKSVRLTLVTGIVAFCFLPYLPVLLSDIRMLLGQSHADFFGLYAAVYLVLFVIIFPSLFYSGRMLPFIYGFIQKDSDNYGLKCGLLYFLNTLGTFFGAVVFGYLLLHLFSIPTLYRFFLLLLLLFYIYFNNFKFKTKPVALVTLFSLTFLALPFKRTFLGIGIYRNTTSQFYNFKGIIPPVWQVQETPEMIEDGPNTTVAITYYKNDQGVTASKSIFVNGKSDSSTTADLPTVSLFSLLPYSMLKAEKYKTAVIGIGTGVSVGVLTSIPEVEKIDVVEISPTIIESAKYFEPENFNFKDSKKVSIYEMDAFKFLKRDLKDKYHFIISEPSNPWVWGIENIFTPYFYQLTRNRLKESGIFVQWYNGYSTNNEAFITILKNLKSVFTFVEVYQTTEGDLALIASRKSLPFASFNRIENLELNGTLEKIGVTNQSRMNLLKLFDSKTVDFIEKNNESYPHEIFFPSLAVEGFYSFFKAEKVHFEDLIENGLRRSIEGRNAIDINQARTFKDFSCRGLNRLYNSIDCQSRFYFAARDSKLLNSKSPEDKLKAYRNLRNKGLLNRDLIFLKTLYQAKNLDSVFKTNILLEMIFDGYFNEVQMILNSDTLFKESQYYENIKKVVQRHQMTVHLLTK